MESYIQEAWYIFLVVVSWMSDTTILTVHGVDVTFMGLLLFGVAFNLILSIVSALLPGWLGREDEDGEPDLVYNPVNFREEDDNSYVYGEAPHGWKHGRWERF